eukprot:g10987.t1
MALLFPTLQVKNTFLSLDDEDEDELDLGLARRCLRIRAHQPLGGRFANGVQATVSSSRAAWALATEPDATNEQDFAMMPRVVTWEEIGMPVAPAHSYSGDLSGRF